MHTVFVFALLLLGGVVARFSSWLLLVASGGSWLLLVSSSGSWWLLVAPGGAWCLPSGW